MIAVPLCEQAAPPTVAQAVVVAEGEVDMFTAPALRARLGRAMGAPSTVVVLDTSAVTFIDCAGLRELIAVRARLVASGRTLHLRSPSPTVLRLLELTGTTKVFTTTA